MNTYEKLKQIPLETLIKNVAEFSNRFGGLPDDAVERLRKFLVLMAQSNHMLVPFEAVDFIYHNLLGSKDLKSRVEIALGGRLEHDSTISGERLAKMYEKTLKLNKAIFSDIVPSGFNKLALSAACCGTGLKQF